LKRSAPAGTAAADVVDTEVASLAIARKLGLTTIDAEVLDFGDMRAIAVSRYDRTAGNGRLHQEDLAQALGLNTDNPNRKFQWGSTMPSLRQAAEVLRLDGGDVGQLLQQVTLSFLLGNTDLHAKNISFLRHDTGQVGLTPAYDIAMHLHHPRGERRFAMDLNGKHRMDDLTVLDVTDEGISWGLEPQRARRLAGQVVEGTAETVAWIDRDAHPGVSQAAWACVQERIQAAEHLLPRPAKARTRSTTKRSGEAVGQAPLRRGPRRPR
jgi:serine/threonine-protein kinase HipA